MKALSLWQPWATYIAIGAKTIETRSWGTPFRGELAIHAAKTTDHIDGTEGMVLKGAGLGHLAPKLPDGEDDGLGFPLGAIVAVVTLEEVFQVAQVADEARRIIIQDGNVYTTTGRVLDVPPADLVLGDLSPGRCGWVLTNVRALRSPVPCRGRQCLFDLPDDVEAQVVAQLATGDALASLSAMKASAARAGIELPGLFR